MTGALTVSTARGEEHQAVIEERPQIETLGEGEPEDLGLSALGERAPEGKR